jgi:uncharacterized RDD family membrane protein YckC
MLAFPFIGRAFGYFHVFPIFRFILPLYWLYHWLFIGLAGRTLGKMVVGIKVTNAQGDRPGLGVAALREILGKTLSALVFCLGFLWIAWDEKKQGWHDRIAGTYVVKAVKSVRKESEEVDYEMS